MRPSLVLALLLLAPAVSALQETFVDEDFGFSMLVPEGMLPVPDEDIRSALSVPDDTPFNLPAAEMPDGKAMHVAFWSDPTGRNRQMRLVLLDGPLPFTKAEELADATVTEMSQQGRIDIIDQTNLEPPSYKGGLMIEVRITADDGAEFGNIGAYFVMGPERYATLSYRAPRDNWSVERPDIMNSLQTVEFTSQRNAQGPSDAGGARQSPTAGRPQGPGAPPGQGRRQGQPASPAAETWSSLEVTGSLVLAVLLVMGLFMGGRDA